jgi:hypothetical protein
VERKFARIEVTLMVTLAKWNGLEVRCSLSHSFALSDVMDHRWNFSITVHSAAVTTETSDFI